MLVVTFSPEGAGNAVEVDGEPYVFARSDLGSFVLPARCRHRGGPLHLAALDPSTCRLVCPWHERKTSVRRHLREGLPAVRRGDTVTVVFPSGKEHRIGYRPLSPSLSGPSGRAATGGS